MLVFVSVKDVMKYMAFKTWSKAKFTRLILHR